MLPYIAYMDPMGIGNHYRASLVESLGSFHRQVWFRLIPQPLQPILHANVERWPSPRGALQYCDIQRDLHGRRTWRAWNLSESMVSPGKWTWSTVDMLDFHGFTKYPWNVANSQLFRFEHGKQTSVLPMAPNRPTKWTHTICHFEYIGVSHSPKKRSNCL